MKHILIIAALLLAGCGQQFTTEPNQKLRRQLFKDCLAAVPRAPQVMGKSDWSEIVDECETAAYYQSLEAVPSKSARGVH